MASAAAAEAATDDMRTEASPPSRWRKVGMAITLLALAGGVVLRVVAPSPLWLDEALSVNIARLGFGDMVDALRRDGHPALYYLVLGWWMDLFGESDVSVRALSGLFSLLTVPVLWAVARRHSEAAAAATVPLALSSPYLLRYGTEARMYALVVLLVALGWSTVERALERPVLGRLLAVAVTAAALVHTHYWSFWVIGAALVVLAWGLRHSDAAGRRVRLRVGGAIVAGSATFVVWLGVFLDQLSSTGTPWAGRARPAEIVLETAQALGGNNRFEGELLGLVLVVLATLGALAVGSDRGRVVLGIGAGPWPTIGAIAATTLALGGAAAIITSGAFESRYAAAVVAFVLVLAARGITMLPGSVPLVVLAAVVAFGLAVGADEARRDRTQGAAVAGVIDQGWEPGDVVVFCPDQVGPATLRELAADASSIAYPRGDGSFVDWRDYAEVIEALSPEAFLAEVEEAAAGHDVWLVAGLGYRSLGNRCEAIIESLDTTRVVRRLVAPAAVFEPMLLTRYEARP